MNIIAKIGTNPYWIAANAHCWFAFAAMTMFPSWITLGIIVFVALIKEFWFDARYEIPKQTFFDGITDFAGYALGALLGAWHAHLYISL